MAVLLVVLAATTGWLGYVVVATSSPTINRVVTPGAIGPCTWFISLDGTTPVAQAMVGGLSVGVGDNMVGTAGQDIATFLNPLLASGQKWCFGPGNWIFLTSLTPVPNLILEGVGRDWAGVVGTIFYKQFNNNYLVTWSGTAQNDFITMTGISFRLANGYTGGGLSIFNARWNNVANNEFSYFTLPAIQFNAPINGKLLNDNLVTANMMYKNTDHGISIVTGAKDAGDFTDNIIDSSWALSGKRAIWVDGQQSRFSGNHVMSGGNATNVEFTSNSCCIRFEHNYVDWSTLGLKVAGTDHLILGNSFIKTNTTFVDIIGQRNLVSNNLFWDSGVVNTCCWADVTFESGAKNNTVTGNIHRLNPAHITGSSYAVREVSGGDYNVVTNEQINMLYGVSNIAITGTHSLARGNFNYDPVGKITNFINGAFIGLCGTGSTVVASTDYVVCGGDIYVTLTGGTSVGITIKDPSNNIIWTPGATISGYFLAFGYKINFGAFTGGAPTVTVYVN